jgi:Flp pilus assembly protein TadB
MTSGQPRDRRGSVGHPYSALNLRLALALFGLIASVVLAVLVGWAGYGVGAIILGIVAATALIDVVVIQRRRRARRRADPDAHHSLFE